MKKREKRRFSLAARFGILFYAAALLLIVALSATLFSYFHNNVENSLLASYSQTVSAKAQTINDLLTRLDLYMNLVTDGNGAFLDTRELYQWVFSTFSVKELLSKGDPVDEIKLKLAWEKDYLLLVPERSFSALVPNDISADSVQRVVKLPEDGISAPVEKGQVIGTMKLILAGEQIGEVNLVASESVERSQWLFLLDELKTFFTSAPFWLCFGAFMLALISYIAYMIIRNKKVLGDVKYRRKKPGLPRR